MQIQIFKQNPSYRIPRRRLNHLMTSILAGESCNRRANIVLIFVTNSEIRRLNRKFLKHDRATDVVAFDLSDDEKQAIEAEIYVSSEKARMQAITHQVSFSDEIMRLAAHGLLHILGYNDRTPKEKNRMLQLGDQYIQNLPRK